MDPDLQITERPGHPDPEISGGPFSKNIFTALRTSVWSNNKGGRGGEVSKNFFTPLRATVWSDNKGGGPPWPLSGSTAVYAFSRFDLNGKT